MSRFVTVLPPREGFGPGRAGAIGLLVHRLALADGSTIVIGGPQAGEPFRDLPFEAVHLARFLPLNANHRYAFAVARRLRALRPDLVEVYNRPDIALALARLLPRTPVCLNLQNDPQGMRLARTPHQRERLLRRLARVICASEFLRRRLLEGVAGSSPESVARSPRLDPVVIHNSLDLAALPPPGPREPLILFCGRIVRDKAPDSFVAACAAALPQLPGWRAEMIGADRFGPDSPDTDFSRTVRQAAARAGVHALGYRDHAAVLQAMACAAIVVVPSRWQEPFGLVALEALACGAALICSDRGGLPEVGGDAARYADPDDPAALAAAILALANDPARRAALAQAGRERARLFDVPVVAARLAVARQEVLDAASG
ncbi:MAG TPA: glycosyltransferase family 4 protein [Acetobacteraceae bacterium]|nr:glycosyltransferase family 4 protein [Acetobacteraceae bacterium]